jgi:Sugar-specific transcriptional regulator TrmB
MPEGGPGGAAHLGALGIGEAEERAYELLLGHPHSAADQLAAVWERPESLAETLARLAARGLAERLPGDPPRYLAMPPEVVLDAHLAGLEEQFKAARDRVTELTLAYHRHRTTPSLEPGTVVEAVTGRVAALRRIEQIRAGVREQVRCMDEAPHASRPVIGARPRPLVAGLPRRAIYGSAAIGELERADPERERAVQQVRVLPSVPMRLYLIDRRLAVLPPRQPETGTLIIVHPSAALDAFSEFFESLWNRALPLPSGQGQSAADQELISLLLAGLTDTASARHLGVSQRTVQRRVAALLDELGAQTRFQAGAKLALRSTGIAADQPLPRLAARIRVVPSTGPNAEGNRRRSKEHSTGTLVVESAFDPRPGTGSR